MAGNPTLEQIVRDAIHHAANAGDQTASFGLALCERIADALASVVNHADWCDRQCDCGASPVHESEA